MKELRQRVETPKIYLALDNLRVHYTAEVTEYASTHNIRLIYLPPYSSEFNPIELLWAFAKRKFRQEIVFMPDLRPKFVERCIIDCVATVSKDTMCKVVKRKKQDMRTWLECYHN